MLMGGSHFAKARFEILFMGGGGILTRDDFFGCLPRVSSLAICVGLC